VPVDLPTKLGIKTGCVVRSSFFFWFVLWIYLTVRDLGSESNVCFVLDREYCMEGFLWLLCFDTRDTEIVPSEETLILRSIGLICMLVFYSEFWAFGSAFLPVFCENLNFFFILLKLSAVCTFWIVLMCWCQKWFLKNKKTSLACISARKIIWKAPATTLSNTQSGLCSGLPHA